MTFILVKSSCTTDKDIFKEVLTRSTIKPFVFFTIFHQFLTYDKILKGPALSLAANCQISKEACADNDTRLIAKPEWLLAHLKKPMENENEASGLGYFTVKLRRGVESKRCSNLNVLT